MLCGLMDPLQADACRDAIIAALNEFDEQRRAQRGECWVSGCSNTRGRTARLAVLQPANCCGQTSNYCMPSTGLFAMSARWRLQLLASPTQACTLDCALVRVSVPHLPAFIPYRDNQRPQGRRRHLLLGLGGGVRPCERPGAHTRCTDKTWGLAV